MACSECIEKKQKEETDNKNEKLNEEDDKIKE